MQHNESVFSSVTLDTEGKSLLRQSGRWAKFIGIVYLCLAALLLIMLVLMLANLNLITNALMNINGVSQEAINFMLGAGKWLFALMIIISSLTLFLNGYFLARFGASIKHYMLATDDLYLQAGFKHLGNYLLLTTILSLGSTLFSLVAILYFMVI